MPSTITSYITFTPGTRAKATEVNTNFNNYRGDLIPIFEDTAASSNSEHDLGTTSHRWDVAYITSVDFPRTTATSSVIISSDTSATSGALLFRVGGTSMSARVRPDGFDGTTMQLGSLRITALTTTSRAQLIAQTFTSDGSFTIPSNVNYIHSMVMGGGGGGGGGSAGISPTNNGRGGAGGSGAVPMFFSFAVTPGGVLSITVGLGGSGGSAGSTTSLVGSTGGSGTDSQIDFSGTTIIRARGAAGGNPGFTATGGVAGTSGFQSPGITSLVSGGGAGGTADGEDGAAGGPTVWASGGDGGSATSANATGGGGGGAGLKAGANGGRAALGTVGSVGADVSGTGGGGGGGGGGGDNNGGTSRNGGRGGGGGNGQVVIYYIGTSDG